MIPEISVKEKPLYEEQNGTCRKATISQSCDQRTPVTYKIRYVKGET